ncbi:phage virion morphogenesis protein [Pseudomonas agarici]|uniref:phage virion morphogenesis protein n=1 Tax=Pseudomonas agarici TaxID=46677 RepID=UPI00159F7C7F|nr:phage virion morphogenesis protein [Pseudomonas agarici]NWB91605.1 phage virion morphogenesis protein [Pseudomonas agarici]
MADLEALEDWAGALLRKLQPAERAKLARSLAVELRRSQQQRVLAQQNADGTRYAPRKTRNLRGKKGRIKRKVKMFQKLRTASYLKARGDGNAISVGFTGRVARIARVHQYGLRDRAERGAREVKYSDRELLGLTKTDLDMIQNGLLMHLTRQLTHA